MEVVCKGRFSNQDDIEKLRLYFNSSMTLYKRWQVSIVDDRGHFYDLYFAAKPTRKQIRAVLRKLRTPLLNKRCYECGKRIRFGDEFTWDDLNYAHSTCLGA